MNRIRKGDEVVVISGKDKGRRGTVLEVLDDRIVVEGVNVSKKHVKPNPQRQEQGGIQDRAMPLAISNVMLWNAAAKKGDRVGFRTLGDGRKVRFFKSNNEVVDTK
jgi:large subunit ribosomal protein L24